MTTDEITKMALEAGLPEVHIQTYFMPLEWFANACHSAGAEAGREAFVKQVYEAAMKAAEAGIDKGMELEREECAKAIEEICGFGDSEDFAAIIRARGKQ